MDASEGFATGKKSGSPVNGVCLVVAAFNEGARIYGAATQALNALKNSESAGLDEILLVDDASTDNTLQEMSRFAKENSGWTQIRIVTVPANRGVGNALLVGVNSTERDRISLIPGDGVFPAESIQAVLELRQHGLVLSDRKARYRGNPVRRWLSKRFAQWFSWLVMELIPDPHSIYLLPTDLVRAASTELWGEWNPHGKTRLDNEYHLDLLRVCLMYESVGAIAPIASVRDLEAHSRVFNLRFLLPFARHCLSLSLARIGLIKDLRFNKLRSQRHRVKTNHDFREN